MKICVVQSRPIRGDICRNIELHKKLISLAVSNGSDLIVFPELSLTGYEPKMAKELATSQDDRRLDDFQQISDAGQITIGIGAPTKSTGGVCISMVLFQPHKARQTYSKKFLHPDEAEFFVPGQNLTGFKVGKTDIALAICYELSVPAHAQTALKSGAEIYMASVAKTVDGVEKAIQRLSEIAATYGMTVFMSNCIGQADGDDCGGKSSVWNRKGGLEGQLNASDEGVLIFDTDTHDLVTKTL